jgi:hypothetical protein
MDSQEWARMARDKKVNIKIRAQDFATKKIQGLTGSLSKLAALIAGGLGLVKLKAFFDDVTRAAGVQQDAVRAMNKQLEINGELTEEVSLKLQGQAAAIQKLTKLGDEQIIQMQTQLLAFGLQADAIDKNVKLTLDMATALGIDLKAATILMGRAFKGSTETLTRYGLTLDANIPKSEKFAELQKLITERFGGRAQAEVDTYAGKVKQLENNYGDLKEAIGENVTENEKFVDNIEIASGALRIVTNWIRNKSKAEQDGFAIIERYIKLTDKQRKALVQLGNTHVVTSFQKELNLLLEDESKMRKELESLVRGGVGFFGNVMQEQIALENDLQKNLNDQARLRRKLNDLLKDPNITTSLDKWINKTNEVTKSTQGLSNELSEADKKVIEQGEKAARIWTAQAEKIKERIALTQEAATAEEQAIIDVADAAFRALQMRADHIKQFNQERLNEAVDLATKEIQIRESLTKKLSDLENQRLRDALQDESLNASERKALLADTEESAESLINQLSDVSTAAELENVINKLEKMDATLKGAEGAEQIRETLKEGFDEAFKLVETLGRAKISPDFDVADLKRKSRTAAEASADEFIKAFKRKMQTADLEVKVTATGTMIGEGG